MTWILLGVALLIFLAIRVLVVWRRRSRYREMNHPRSLLAGQCPRCRAWLYIGPGDSPELTCKCGQSVQIVPEEKWPE